MAIKRLVEAEKALDNMCNQRSYGLGDLSSFSPIFCSRASANSNSKIWLFFNFFYKHYAIEKLEDLVLKFVSTLFRGVYNLNLFRPIWPHGSL